MNSTALLVTSSLGWLGAAGTVGAYALVSHGRLDVRSLKFQLLNVVGGAFLAISALSHDNWPSAATNLLWVALGAYALYGTRHALRAASVRWVQRLRPSALRRPAPVDIVDRVEHSDRTDVAGSGDTDLVPAAI